jgi:hypothetical protein
MDDESVVVGIPKKIKTFKFENQDSNLNAF